MPARTRKKARADRATARCLALLALLVPAGLALAQDRTPAKVEIPDAIDPDEITGRDFAGVRLETTPQVGDLVLAAARVWAWSEPTSTEISQDTQRLYMQKDVVIDFGVYHFTAAQAVVWIEPITVGTGAEARTARQVAIYFDRVSDPGAQAGFALSGDRLMVTGVLDGEVKLHPDWLPPGKPQAPFVAVGEQKLAQLLRRLIAGEKSDAGQAQPPGPGETALQSPSGVPVVPGMSRPYEPNSPLGPDGAAAREDYRLLPPAERRPAIFAKKAIITFAPGLDEPVRLLPAKEGEERALVLNGGVVMLYNDRAKGRTFQVSAQRAVAFFEPGTIVQTLQAPADKVKGVYLEGDVVATDGQYTIRGPKVYYDVQNNRAVMLNAVFFTYDSQHQLPLYVRAAAVHQEAQGQFTAHKATLSTSAFFEPHLSLGVQSVTVTQTKTPRKPTVEQVLTGEDPGEHNVAMVNAKGLTMRAGRTPFFWWPGFKGDPKGIPLTSIQVASSSGSGVAIKTRWDAFALLGIERPEELQWHVRADGYFDRGAALGTDLDWSNKDSGGNLLGYMIINDNGTDHLSSGDRIQQDGETRGILLGEHIWDIDRNWKLFLEGAYVSDPTFVDSFYRVLGEARREFKNDAYLQATDANAVLSLDLGVSINDFTPNQYLLQTPGYNTIKQPEVRYTRVNDDMLSGIAPGKLSWSQDWRAGRMYLNFTEPTAAELGFDTVQRAEEAFGILPNQSIGDSLRARGFTESAVLRADTRHELSSQLDLGPVRFTPFLVGRATAYNQDFQEFSPDNDSKYRLWGAAGLRMATTLQHVDNTVDNRFFDLHRIRHIVEPNLTLWSSASTIDQNDLPIYDNNVESLADGSAVKVGVTQTWQTQRGGPGRMYSVDVLKVTTEYVNSSSDADRESPIMRFFDAFPEYSLLGDFATLDVAWQMTDAVAISLNTIYDFEINQPARTSAGGVIQHSEEFSSFAEARYINARDITLVSFGANYKLTSRYSVSASATLDTDEGDLQSISTTIRRRFPDNTLGITVRYNNISSTTDVGVLFEPLGKTEARAAALRRLRAEDKNLLENTNSPFYLNGLE